MFELIASDNPEKQIELINRLAISTSPYALCLLEEIVANENNSHVIGYAHQAIPSVKEQLFQAYKAGRSMEKEKAKEDFAKLESAELQEHVEALLGLSYYQHLQNQLNPPKKNFARAFALDPTILENERYQELGGLVFGSHSSELKADIAEFTKLQNKHDRVIEGKYPWYMYLFDVSVFVSWIVLLALLFVAYIDLGQEYPARCRNNSRTVCFNWQAAQADGFARIAPSIPRQNIATALMLLLLSTGIRLLSYILQTQKQIVNLNWLAEARGNVFEDIEEELLKVFTPRRKKT
jgi:hypothetical protein